jgi:hypothetical protein
MAYPTPYPDLNEVIQELVAGVQLTLGDSLVAVCLQGSFALGDFDQHSDVDFVVAVREELTDDQVARLTALHKGIYGLACPWAQHLEGSYFPVSVLRRCDRRAQPLWYLEHGSDTLVRSDHCNTIVVRWVVREHGVALAGPSPETLVDSIPVIALRQAILATIHDWGQQILNEPEPYRNRFYQSFIVLSYCRMLHDLVRGLPGSKRAGADWAMLTLDPSWVGLIERAWGGRPDPAVAFRQPADPVDFASTLEFVKYVRQESERYDAEMLTTP